jgi:hypothetical protein
MPVHLPLDDALAASGDVDRIDRAVRHVHDAVLDQRGRFQVAVGVVALVIAVMENPVLRLALWIERALVSHVGGTRWRERRGHQERAASAPAKLLAFMIPLPLCRTDAGARSSLPLTFAIHNRNVRAIMMTRRDALAQLEHVPVRLNHAVSFVMPALVAGIHVLLAATQEARRGWPGQARP